MGEAHAPTYDTVPGRELPTPARDQTGRAWGRPRRRFGRLADAPDHVFVHSRRKIEFQNGYARKRDDLGVVFITFSCTAVSNCQNRTAMDENVMLGVCHAAFAPPEALR